MKEFLHSSMKGRWDISPRFASRVKSLSLDFDNRDSFQPHRYAFKVGEAEFDEIFGRIRDRKLPYWADPGRRQLGEINHHDDGRGVYFEDPNGHLLEVMTVPETGS